MDDLVTWLRAQLDEDEKRARICDAQDWRYVGYGTIVDRDVDGWQSVPDAARIFSFVDPDRSDEAVHAITHDPLRVLDEVDAKRRILDEHQPNGGECRTCCGEPYMEETWDGEEERTDWKRADKPWPCPTVRLLALPYADWPGYRPEWRP